VHDLTMYATTRESQRIVSLNRHSEEELSISQSKSKIEELPIPYQEEGRLGSTVHWHHSLRDEPQIGPISGS